MGLIDYIKGEYNSYFGMYNYLKDLREGKTTEEWKGKYVKPPRVSIEDENLLDQFVETAIWASFALMHPKKAGLTYLWSLAEIERHRKK